MPSVVERFWSMCVQMGRKMWFLSALFDICFFILLDFCSNILSYTISILFVIFIPSTIQKSRLTNVGWIERWQVSDHYIGKWSLTGKSVEEKHQEKTLKTAITRGLKNKYGKKISVLPIYLSETVTVTYISCGSDMLQELFI